MGVFWYVEYTFSYRILKNLEFSNIRWGGSMAYTVRHRILYKTLLLAHKAIHHDSPDYLASLLKLKLPTSTTTRSTNTFLLQLPPKHNLHSTNTRAWAISVPYSWNTLPTSIRTTPSTHNFKKLLKTYLFNMKH